MKKTKKDWVTVRKAAEALGVGITTIHRYIENELLEAYQLAPGGNWRVKKESLSELLGKGDER